MMIIIKKIIQKFQEGGKQALVKLSVQKSNKTKPQRTMCIHSNNCAWYLPKPKSIKVNRKTKQ